MVLDSVVIGAAFNVTPQVHLVTFAEGHACKTSQRLLNSSFERAGIASHVAWDIKSLKASLPQGAMQLDMGRTYHFKPFIVRSRLQEVPLGDFVLYEDSSQHEPREFDLPVQPLIDKISTTKNRCRCLVGIASSTLSKEWEWRQRCLFRTRQNDVWVQRAHGFAGTPVSLRHLCHMILILGLCKGRHVCCTQDTGIISKQYLIHSGTLLFQHNTYNLEFLRTWERLSMDPRIVLNSPFGDQSILGLLSLIWKMPSVWPLPEEEGNPTIHTVLSGINRNRSWARVVNPWQARNEVPLRDAPGANESMCVYSGQPSQLPATFWSLRLNGMSLPFSRISHFRRHEMLGSEMPVHVQKYRIKGAPERQVGNTEVSIEVLVERRASPSAWLFRLHESDMASWTLHAIHPPPDANLPRKGKMFSLADFHALSASRLDPQGITHWASCRLQRRSGARSKSMVKIHVESVDIDRDGSRSIGSIAFFFIFSPFSGGVVTWVHTRHGENSTAQSPSGAADLRAT